MSLFSRAAGSVRARAAAVLPLVVAAAVEAAPAQPQTAGRDSAPALLRQAEDAYAAGASADAMRLFTQVIEALGRVAPDTYPEDAASLSRALYFRARLTFAAGQPVDARADLERLFAATPDAAVDPAIVGRPFAEFFDAERTKAVTDLELVLDPPDAEVSVDGRRVDPGRPVAAVRPGRHVIEARRAGHADLRRELDVPAGGRVRIDVKLEKSPGTGDEAKLAAPTTWKVWHLHRGTSCSGQLFVKDGRIGFRASPDGAHSWEASLAQVEEVKGNRSFGGNLEYTGAFHIKLEGGRNYNFTLGRFRVFVGPEGVPRGQGVEVVSQLQAAVDEHKRRR
jgi:hypothetical protein